MRLGRPSRGRLPIAAAISRRRDTTSAPRVDPALGGRASAGTAAPAAERDKLRPFPPLPKVVIDPLPWPELPRNTVAAPPLDLSSGLAPPLDSRQILGNNSMATQPDLRVAHGELRRGIAGPRIKGYDLLFELRYGEHPVVRPGKIAALLESQVPVWTRTSSYELARRAIESRQLPPPGQVRAEDFLAAMDYGFPAPSGAGLGIRTACGPSPLGLPGTSLMQIGVQAGRFDRSRFLGGRDAAVDLTLLVDVSSSGAIADRWQAVRGAIADLVERLGPRDRLSIVLFNQHPQVLVEHADRAKMRSILPVLEGITPRGLANLGAALETAAAVARRETAGAGANPSATGSGRAASRLVLLTDGMGWIDPSAAAHVKDLLKQTVAAGLSWTVVDVRPDEIPDPRLEEIALIGGRAVRHAQTGHAIDRELREALAGRPDVVASGVSIKVKFNPDAIESYRLIGHDPTLVGGMVSGPLAADLRSDEAATALYEVELKPDGADLVATVEVSWHEPGTEAVHHLVQPVGRLQFAPSWMETPLSLQLATLAAETAEVLRGSYFAPPGAHAIDQVAELANRSNSALQARPCFRQLKTLIDMVHPSRAAGR